MVYVRLVFLALLASLCGQVSHGACSRRVRAGSALPIVVPSPCLPAPCPGRRYERTLEEIISKLVNALIYTTIQNGNGGGSAGGSGSGKSGSGSNSGDSLISLDLGVGGTNVVGVDVLPGSSGSSDADAEGGGTGASSGGSGPCSCEGSNTDIMKLLESLLKVKLEISDQELLKLTLLESESS